MWDTLQAFCSTVTGMLASKAVLTGMGVGNEEATVSAALWQAVVRRNIGKVARIVFVTFKGADLDDNAKSWRIVADVLNDAALAIELVSPTLCPLSGDCNANWAFFAAVSMAEIFRSVVGVAGGASRAALTQHFALKDNFGDVSAKDGSQEVFVEILGSTMGMWIVGLCASSKATAWMAFGALTAMHILANVMACRAVCLNTFNRQRAQLVAAEWVKTGEVLTPQQAAGRESVVFFGGSGVRRMSITMGATLSNILSAKSVRGSSKNTRDRHSDSDGLVQDGALRAAFERASDWPFVVVEQGDAGGMAGGGSVMAGIREGASGREIVLCYFFAYLTAVQGVSASPLLQPDYGIPLTLGRRNRQACHVERGSLCARSPSSAALECSSSARSGTQTAPESCRH